MFRRRRPGAKTENAYGGFNYRNVCVQRYVEINDFYSRNQSGAGDTSIRKEVRSYKLEAGSHFRFDLTRAERTY